MKTKLLFIISIVSIQIHTQVAYVKDLINPAGLIIIDDYLYFTQKDTNGKISKVDLTQNKPTVIDVVSGLKEPVDLINDGNNILYVIERLGGLYKVDLTQNNPTPVFILDPTGNTSNRSRSISLKDDYIYISLSDENKIVKVNINDSFPTTSQEFISNIGFVSETLFVKNDLYFTHFIAGVGIRLSKIDVTNPNPTPVIVENTILNLSDLTVVDDYMYVTQWNSGAKIAKINLTDTLPTNASTVITGLDFHAGSIVIRNDKIYVASHINPGRIMMYTDKTLGIQNLKKGNKETTIYPNPTSEKLTVHLKNNDFINSVEVFNLTGKKILETFVKNTSEIILNVTSLSNGVYILKTTSERGTSIKKLIVEK